MKHSVSLTARAAERQASGEPRERLVRSDGLRSVAMHRAPRPIEEHGVSWLSVGAAWKTESATTQQTTPRSQHDGPPSLQLVLPAHADSIAAVRRDVRTLGESLSLDPQVQADICLATTEACTNVVLHAYPEGHEGPLEVTVWVDGSDTTERELTVLVRDSGRGLSGLGAPASEDDKAEEEDSSRERLGLGLGLHLMGSLAKSLRLGNGEHGCTEVEMTFAALSCPPNSKAMPQSPSGE